MGFKGGFVVPGLGPAAAARGGGWVDAGRVVREDAVAAVVLAAVAVFLALNVRAQGVQPDAVGWVLLAGAHVPAVWRRRAPLVSFLGVVACAAPYHVMGFNEVAPVPVGLLGLFTVALTGRLWRSAVVCSVIVGLLLVAKFSQGMAEGAQALRISGWIVAVVLCGVYARAHRQYVDSVIERAERAERTREEEARRRVAEERLRVARDLHDLLAHSITLVGVQTSVAAHVLNADPERLDRAAVARALDDIAGTCRAARGELRATLEVLRSSPDEARGPLPGVEGIGELVAAARSSGAGVVAAVEGGVAGVPPAVGAAAYRIVQEALTNAVRHGGPGLGVEVTVRVGEQVLEVSVVDDGCATAGQVPSGGGGFGLVGMRERARSVLGTLEAGPREGGGFGVRAVLPLDGARQAGPGGEAPEQAAGEAPEEAAGGLVLPSRAPAARGPALGEAR
ncbi:signal transduction histidine kinase [Streptomyces phaeochromogenes]|nr:signal transduction histidine kinase [Streptomyces phaeochromogenes]